MDIDLRRIDKIDGSIRRCVSIQTGGRIDLERGADDDNDIRRGKDVDSTFYLRNCFTEEYNMRTILRPVGSQIAKNNLLISAIHHILLTEPIEFVACVLRTYLCRLSMDMQDTGTASAFVEVIDILGNDIHSVPVFQGGQKVVGVVGFYSTDPPAQGIVEIQDHARIVSPRIGRRNLHRIVVVPHPTIVPVCGESALGTYAGTAQNCYLFSVHGHKDRKRKITENS